MRQTSKSKYRQSKSWLIVLTIITILLGFLVAFIQVEKIENQMHTAFLNKAHQFSSSITLDYVEALTGTKADTLLPQYQRLKSQLISLRKIDSTLRFVYLLGNKRSDNAVNNDSSYSANVVILIDSEPVASGDYSPPGQVYDEMPEEYQSVFTNKLAIVTKPVEDRWGTWVTAMVPLKGMRTSNFDIVLGVDIDVREWNSYIFQKALLPIIITITLLFIVFIIVFNWEKLIKQNHRWFCQESVASGLTGIIISLFLAYTIYCQTKRNFYHNFQQMAESRIAIFEDAIHDHHNIELEGTIRFFQGSEFVTTEEFVQYTGYLTNNRFVNAWMWVEVVPVSEIEKFKTKERLMNGKIIELREKEITGISNPVSDRKVYYPVTRVAPLTMSESILGLDLGTDSLIFRAISEAINTGLNSACSLAGNNMFVKCDNCLLVIRPVFSINDSTCLEGFVMALLDVGSLFDNALNDGFIEADYSIEYPNDGKRTYNYPVIFGNDDLKRMSINQVAFAFGKNIVISIKPNSHFISLNPLKGGAFVAIVGILVSILIAVIIAMVKHRQQELERLVQKRTNALRASEEHLAATLRSIGDGVITCNSSGQVTSLNIIAENLTGWKTEDAKGLNLEEVFHIIDAQTNELAQNPATLVLESGQAVDLANHIVLISKNGQKYHIADSCAPITNESKQVTGVVLVFRDVTEAYLQRELLKEERERVQYILNVTGTGISIVDENYNLIYVDEGYQQKHGVPNGGKCFECFMNFKEPCHNCNVQKAFETKQVYVSEETSYDTDGIVYEVHTIPFKNNKGEWLVAIFKIDISQRKKAENELQQQQLLLRTLIDNLPAFIYVKDQNARKIISNTADFKNLGFESEEEVIGKTDYELLGHEEAKKHFEDDQLVLKKGAFIIDKEESFKRKNGEIIWLSTSKIPLFDNNGKIVGLVGVGHDITQKRKAEKELLEAKIKAEESDKLKTAFLHNMSHEIRTPLNAISGFSEMLAYSIPDKEKIERYASIIHKSSKQLLAIINDVLTISSIETKQEVLNIESVNINDIIDELYTIFKHQANIKGINFSVENAFIYEQAFLQTDRTKVMQILSNLLVNAIKFTNTGFVKLGYVYLKERAEIEFFVKDSGIGIAEDARDLIFERFRQADESIQHNYGGTGLGLSICKGFAELLNGRIRLESKLGEGSTFYFSMPYQPIPQNAQKQLIDEEDLSLKGDFLVLVAEDDEVSAMFLNELLLELNCKIINTTNGNEALNIFKQHKIDLVFMDIRMPGMNGYEAACAIKKIDSGVPIIIQSAYTLSVDIDKQDNCFDEWISKPIDSEIVKSLIRKYRTKRK